MKNIKFALIWGIVFWLLGIALFVTSGDVVFNETFIYLPLTIGIFYVLQMITVVLNKSKRLGEKYSNRIMSKVVSQEVIDDVEGSKKNPDLNYLQMLVGLHYVGEYITTGVAILPAILLVTIFAIIFGQSISENLALMLVISGGSIISAFWLFYLEKRFLVRVTLPLIPIPLLWLTPLGIVFGIYSYFYL